MCLIDTDNRHRLFYLTHLYEVRRHEGRIFLHMHLNRRPDQDLFISLVEVDSRLQKCSLQLQHHITHTAGQMCTMVNVNPSIITYFMKLRVILTI